MKAVLAALMAVVCFSAVALAQDQQACPPGATNADYCQQQEAQQAKVVRTVVKRPDKRVYRRAKLHIPSRPTVGQVQSMIRYEASMWGVSAAGLSRRVDCESHYHWWASNGQYQGVLQFSAGTFYRGLRTIRTLRVAVLKVTQRRMHSRVYRHWNTGRITRHKGRLVRQTVVTTKRGRLSGDYTDAWTQIRIGAQAMAGISGVHSSEWSCGA